MPDALEFATLADWLPVLTGRRADCPDPACAPAPVHPEALAALRSVLADRLAPQPFGAPDRTEVAC